MTIQDGIKQLNAGGYEQQWFSAVQLCARLHIGKTTFYRWIAEGNFPDGKRMGKRAVRWHISVIQDWEDNREGVA